MKLTNGKDTVELTDEIQIRAYLSSGYTEIKATQKKATQNRGAKNAGGKTK